MITLDQAREIATRLRARLAQHGTDLSDAAVLELVSAGFGSDDEGAAVANEPIRFLEAVPILRIFDETKAREFYCDFLGFEVVFEHRFEPGLPLYMGVKRAGLQLHLSEHHGDACPGSTVYVPMTGIHAFNRELLDKQYNYGRPGVETEPWGDVMEVHDPFGNRIRFCEAKV